MSKTLTKHNPFVPIQNYKRVMEVELTISDDETLVCSIDLYQKNEEVKQFIDEIFPNERNELKDKIVEEIIKHKTVILNNLRLTSNSISERLFKEGEDKKRDKAK